MFYNLACDHYVVKVVRDWKGVFVRLRVGQIFTIGNIEGIPDDCLVVDNLCILRGKRIRPDLQNARL